MFGTDYNVGDTISFDLYPENIIGASMTNVLVLGVLDADTLNALGKDPIGMHAQVYPSLPPGTPNDAYGYSYLKLQSPNRQVSYIGMPWIKQDTVVLTNEVDIVVRIRRKKAQDVTSIAAALSSNGHVLDPDSITIQPGTQAP